MTTALQYKLAVVNWRRQQLQEQINAMWDRLTTTQTTAEVRERVVEESIRAKGMLKEFGLPMPP